MLSPAVRTMLNQKRKTKRGKRDRLKKEQQFRKKRGTKQYPVHDNMEDTIKMFQEEVIKVNGIQSHQIQGYYYHKDGTKIGEGIAGSVYDCALPKAEGGGAYAVKVMSYAINELLHEKLEEFMHEFKVHSMLRDDERVVRALGGFIEYTEGMVTCGIIMKRMDTTLAAYLANKELTLKKAAMIALELLEVAVSTEKMQFMHHDLHMNNILCTDQGTCLCACDYGQAASFGARTEDVVKPYKYNEDVRAFDADFPHYSWKHRTVNADESCDHFSIAYHILCVLHGYEHEVVQYFKANAAAVLVGATARTRGIFAVMLPIRALLKPCLEGGTKLDIQRMKEELEKLVHNSTAESTFVKF